MLLDNPVVTIKTCYPLHSATLLPIELGNLEHHCLEIIDTIYSHQPDLESEPLPRVEEAWLTDRSSFIKEGKRGWGRGQAIQLPP